MRSVTHLGLAAVALTLSVAAYCQTPSSTPSTPTTQDPSTQAPTTPANKPAASDQTTPPPANTPDTTQIPADVPAEKPIPGHPTATPKESKDAANKVKAQNKTDTLPSPGENLDPHIKPGSEDDVNAVGTRNIGGRGVGNWYSTDWEIRNGKQYSMEIEKSAHLVTDPVIVEYVNRVGQNIVKNSDCKVPFTIKVIDSDEINAMALPGGFFYVNSGLILAADEEAELAAVMGHEIAHVAARHGTKQATKGEIMQLATIPLILLGPGGWAGYGLYEGLNLAIPMSYLKFTRDAEREADFLGLQYMYKSGYDPNAFVSFFEKIEAEERRRPG